MADYDEKAAHYAHQEHRRASVTDEAFNRRHSLTAPGNRSARASFSRANEAMVLPLRDHVEISDTDAVGNSIEDMGAGWFVWLVAATASIAGSLFGYDTGIISAVLVYLNNDLDGRPTSSSEKELITSLCSGGAFIGAIIAGLTADKVGCPYVVLDYC